MVFPFKDFLDTKLESRAAKLLLATLNRQTPELQVETLTYKDVLDLVEEFLEKVKDTAPTPDDANYEWRGQPPAQYKPGRNVPRAARRGREFTPAETDGETVRSAAWEQYDDEMLTIRNFKAAYAALGDAFVGGHVDAHERHEELKSARKEEVMAKTASLLLQHGADAPLSVAFDEITQAFHRSLGHGGRE